ncbi:hypothetical protein FBEOM_713 [Fusarium beomiforme]|uniref:Uncharacterized protein n=1 Tax=Fusarium beomiforme TaxID=44412 RepID=A0A9P5AUU2_9HYPO|nr:hypothetical protein FBEOM_713 [Fusarium beomiforme]
MLSPTYMSIYQQYKVDTDSVATWLATSTKAYGFDAGGAAGAAAQDTLKKRRRGEIEMEKAPPEDSFTLGGVYQGELDLAAVPLPTNTAFEFDHSMEMDMKKMMDKFGGTATFAHQCFDTVCNRMGIDKDKKNQGESFNLAGYEMARALTLNTMIFSKGYIDHSCEMVIPGNYNGSLGWYNERLRANGRNSCEKWDHDKTTLLKIFSSLRYLTTNAGQGAIEDELIRGMGDAFKDRRSWAALIDLPDTAERKEVLETMEQGLMAHSDGNEEYKFLRRNPLHFGLLLHHMRSVLHQNGIKTAAPSGGLMTATQLYQALKKEDRIPEGLAWEDLEEFWGYQGNHVSFSLNKRIRVDFQREPWTIATVGELLTEGRKQETLDGKGHVQEGRKQKAKESNWSYRQLAQVVNSEIPRIGFNYFIMHNVIWSLLTDLKGTLTLQVGPEFFNYVPSEDLLPYVVGCVFATASGHGSTDVRERLKSWRAVFEGYCRAYETCEHDGMKNMNPGND